LEKIKVTAVFAYWTKGAQDCALKNEMSLTIFSILPEALSGTWHSKVGTQVEHR
jgi:hypothetical protein